MTIADQVKQLESALQTCIQENTRLSELPENDIPSVTLLCKVKIPWVQIVDDTPDQKYIEMSTTMFLDQLRDAPEMYSDRIKVVGGWVEGRSDDL